ncbi:unnamed protein product [Mytilus edulis]|uniref:Uncharacterized protein n=1 Tax=Mytilus edulis TaxID=6550 RepID=A0A8S3R7A2_MYTED|nr:unnamed protein product [Mytilus edulis]
MPSKFLNQDRKEYNNQSQKLLVTDIERPVCSILNRTGWCSLSSLNTANCSLYKWTVTTRVSFSGTILKSISTTGLSEMHHDNITALTEGPLLVYTNGDCCSPYFQLTIVDADNFISQCNEKVSNGEPVKSVEIISIVDFDVDVVSSTVGIVIGIGASVCVSGVIIGIMLFILKFNKHKLVYRIEPKADMSSNTRPSFDKVAMRAIMKTKLQKSSWK